LAHADLHVLDRLYDVIEARRGADPATSRTARLFHKGPAKIAQKVGEEAVEAAIAALVEPRERLVSESADLLYHLLVLWAAQGVRPADVWAELERRGAERPSVPRA
jgi:phosphoribosyl-ATP pyrophosphohydrolase